jgi:hypothetical protein
MGENFGSPAPQRGNGQRILEAKILATMNGAPLQLATMTKAVRNALTAVAGMVVYQTDNTPGLRAFNGSHWVRFTETNDD